MSDCAIIILTYNSSEDICETLRAAKDQITTLSYDIYVADNGSSDGTVEQVRNNHPFVEVLEFERNHGSSRGYNLALEAVFERSDPDYIIYLNPDTTVHREWLHRLYRGLLESNAVAAMSSVFEPGDEEYTPDERIEEKSIMKVKDLSQTGYVYNGEFEAADGPVRTLHLAGNSMMFDSGVLRELDHVFEEAFFLFADDIDIALRLNVLGEKTVMVPDAIVYHHQYARADPDMSLWLMKKHTWALSGRILSFYKNTPLVEFLLLLPFVLSGGILNARMLSGSPLKKCLYALGGVPLTLYCFLVFLLRFQEVRQHRKAILSARKRERFWLFRRMVGSSPPRLNWATDD